MSASLFPGANCVTPLQDPPEHEREPSMKDIKEQDANTVGHRPDSLDRRSEPESVVRRFLDEVVNGGHVEHLGRFWASDLRWHGGSMGEIHGLADFTDYMSKNASGAFADMHLEIEDAIAFGEKVVVRFTNSGIHTGPFMGAQASGRHARWSGIGFYEVRDGRIQEAWFGEDILGMLIQVGAVNLDA
jgi:predicted ester cyclase